MSLIVNLPKNDGGFFCQIWKLMSRYIFTKKYNLKLYINDSNWMFNHKNGWIDYFEKNFLEIINESTLLEQPVYLDVDERMLDQFSLNEYKEAFNEIFILNDSLKQKVIKTLNDFNLNEYDSIMIRRGDKMYGESYYISTEMYVQKLLEKDTKKIFVQTDDYNAYLEVCDIVKDKNIEVYTTCPEDKLGCFVFNYSPEVGSTLTKENDTYLKNLTKTLKKKSVNMYSSDEMKEHVEEMLVGLEICLRSRYLATDYQSNVTRYLVVNHNNHINVETDNTDLNYNVPMRCPTYGFVSIN
jgi:hypothetical protein